MSRRRRPTASRTEVRELLRAAAPWRPAPQWQIAQEMGVHQSTVSRWASGETHPSDKRLRRLAKIVEDCKRLRRQTPPAVVALVDGVVSADAPQFLIAEAKTITAGIDEALERIHASMDVAEIDTLTAFAKLGFERLREIKQALLPLTKVPS
jgi:transcriptional regulator with XRE-family HTH domain